MEENLRLNQSKGTEVAAAISGDEQRVPDFQKKADFQAGNNPLPNSMTLRGSSFILDVTNGREIPKASLKKDSISYLFSISKAVKSYSVIIHTNLHLNRLWNFLAYH